MLPVTTEREGAGGSGRERERATLYLWAGKNKPHPPPAGRRKVARWSLGCWGATRGRSKRSSRSRQAHREGAERLGGCGRLLSERGRSVGDHSDWESQDTCGGVSVAYTSGKNDLTATAAAWNDLHF